MPPAAESDRSAQLEEHSAQQLTSLLRRASNRLEMLLNPNLPHHEDDAERQRLMALTEAQRVALQREAMNTITAVRAEFRRRSSNGS